MYLRYLRYFVSSFSWLQTVHNHASKIAGMLHFIIIPQVYCLSGERLHDFYIGLTNTSVTSVAPTPSLMRTPPQHICAAYTGPVPDDQFVHLQCAPHSVGRYLVVQIESGTGNYLTMCEVDVYQDTSKCTCFR